VSLTNRLSLFFLAALALVLAGFSVSLYLVARTHLERQLTERLAAAVDTLTAAAELEPDGIDWEPQQRRLTLGQEGGPDQVRWLVRDGTGCVVDRSANLPKDAALATALERDATEVDADGQHWRLRESQVTASIKLPAAAQPPADHPKYEQLVLTAAISDTPMRSLLQRLTLTLALLSGFLWCFAAVLGRWLCRRALTPLTQMAATARQITAATWQQRLPVAPTRDELHDLGRSFNDLLDRLQEAFERQRRFTGDASHQLRTPLTAMLGQIEVLLRRQRTVEEYRQVLGVVHGQAQNLRHIVEMLLFLARADGEAQLPSLQSIDLRTWLPEYLAHWADHPRIADVEVEKVLDGPLWVRVQPRLLGQLLDNLLDNAFKYSALGTPVRIRLDRDGARVRCTIEDAGRGIAANDLPHIFEPFFRSAAARAQGIAGIGLGLAVARRLAAAFGGTLEARSRAGEGSCFALVLPLAPEHKPAGEASAPTPSERATGRLVGRIGSKD
jgi:two-component system, OmpR family, sensor kinase